MPDKYNFVPDALSRLEHCNNNEAKIATHDLIDIQNKDSNNE